MIAAIFLIAAGIMMALAFSELLRNGRRAKKLVLRESVDINVPLRDVFDNWVEFENYPQFMEGVLEVRQLDHTKLQCRTELLGDVCECDVVIEHQILDRSIAWTSSSAPPIKVKVSFQRLSRSRTRVHVETRTMVGEVAANQNLLQLLRINLRKSLQRCKVMLEERGNVALGSPYRKRRALP